MALLDSNGDSSVYVKADNAGNVKIGAGGQDRVVVGRNSTSITGDVNISQGDLNAVGGYVRTYQFVHMRTLQNSTPVMTGSVIQLSGTAAAGNSTMKFLTRVPLRGSGSIIGISLITEDGTVKSGSLSASVFVNGTYTGASLLMFTGTVASTTFAKDTYTFNGNSYLQVQLTASDQYHNDLVASCSFLCNVDVEF